MAKGEDITTKFKVDISDLKKGISEANRQIKLANAEFKAASAGMDDWSKSSAGISAKLKQLESILAAQNSKLKNYKDQLAAIEQTEQKNIKRADELKAKLQQLASQGVSKTSAEYKKYEKALNDVEKEQLANRTAADNLKITILNQQAAFNSTEKEIKNYNSVLDKLENEADQAENAVDDLSDEMSNSKAAVTELTGGFTVMKGALASLVADGFRKAIEAAKDFAKEMITTAANVKAETAMFEQTFGDMGDEASAAIKRVADSSGILETRLNVAGARLYAFARSNGGEATESLALMEEALQASADSAAYYDKSLDETTETMMSFLKGNFANDAALGISATEFTRNAKATELFGKKYNELTEIQKQQTLLKMVTDAQKVSGAFGQASRESDGWENVMGNLNETWRQFQAKVGTPFLEALIPVIQRITASFQEWMQSVDWEAFGRKVEQAINKVIEVFKWIIEHKNLVVKAMQTIIATFVAAKILTFVTSIKKAITVFTGLKTATTAATTAQLANNAAVLANPYVLLAAVVLAAVAAFAVFINRSNETTKQLQKEAEAVKEETEAVRDNRNAYVEATQARSESINQGVAELNYYEKLFDELQQITDANGKVKDGYQARADFIVNQLSSALGTEIKLIDGQIQGYGNLIETFDKVMEKKKAMLILDSQEDAYVEALKNKTSEMQKAMDAQAKMLEVGREMEKKASEQSVIMTYNQRKNWQDQMDALQEKFDGYKQQYEDHEATYEDYLSTIGMYEYNYEQVHNETYDNIAMNEEDFRLKQKNGQKQNITDLQNNIKDTENQLNYLKDLKKKNNTDIYNEDIAFYEKQLAEMKTSLSEQSTAIAQGQEKNKTSWLDGANKQLSALTGKKVEFEKAANGQVQMYVDGIKQGEPTAEEAMKKLADDSIREIKDKKMDAKAAGEYLIDGVNNGIKNQNKQSTVFRAIADFGKGLLARLKASLQEKSPSKATEKMGQFLLDGLGIGIKDKENTVLKQVSNLGDSIISKLQDQLSNNVELNGFKNNLEVGLNKAKSSLSALNNTTSRNGLLSNSRNITNSNVNNFTQNIYAPKTPSRIELYRDARNLLNYTKREG